MNDSAVGERLAEQQQLYGAPLGDLVRDVMGPLGLSQAAVSRILGLSPAMLSQLMSGQRTKIGNPRVVYRLQLMLALAEDSPRLSRQVLATRMAEIARARTDLTTQERSLTATGAAGVVTDLLHAVASGRELDRAASVLDRMAPGVAEVLRTYGLGTAADAERHWRSVEHLME